MYANARYANAEGTIILAERNGVPVSIPVDEANRDYRQLMEEGVQIMPYVTPGPTAADVRAEAARRMRALVGARDDRHLDIIITNGLREAARLLQKEVSGQALTPEEQARKQQLQQIDAAIEAIRAASNRLEAMTPIPDDYQADKYWPPMLEGAGMS